MTSVELSESVGTSPTYITVETGFQLKMLPTGVSDGKRIDKDCDYEDEFVRVDAYFGKGNCNKSSYVYREALQFKFIDQLNAGIVAYLHIFLFDIKVTSLMIVLFCFALFLKSGYAVLLD